MCFRGVRSQLTNVGSLTRVAGNTPFLQLSSRATRGTLVSASSATNSGADRPKVPRFFLGITIWTINGIFTQERTYGTARRKVFRQLHQAWRVGRIIIHDGLHFLDVLAKVADSYWGLRPRPRREFPRRPPSGKALSCPPRLDRPVRLFRRDSTETKHPRRATACHTVLL